MSEQPQSRKDKFTEKVFGFSPPPQPQEWTPENLSRVTNTMGVSSVSELNQAICDAHNDALAAEREKTRSMIKRVREICHTFGWRGGTNDILEVLSRYERKS